MLKFDYRGKKMKRVSRIICIIIAAVMIAAAPVCGHSGRTDSSGGHRDNRNASGLGYYHYHCGGYPPHLHNNGVCPYRSGSSGSSAASKVSKPRVTKPAKVRNVRTTSTYALRTTVKWNRVSGAAGYKVYRSAGSSYKCVKTIKSGSTLKYTDKSVLAGKTYYYKVRAFKKVNGSYKYGNYSSSKKVTTKKNNLYFDFDWDDYEDNGEVGLDFERLWYSYGSLCAEIAVKNCTDNTIELRGIDSIRIYCNDSRIGSGTYYSFDNNVILAPGQISSKYRIVFDSSSKTDLIRKDKIGAYFRSTSVIDYEIRNADNQQNN